MWQLYHSSCLMSLSMLMSKEVSFASLDFNPPFKKCWLIEEGKQGFLQCLYVCWQCVCTGGLWTHRARPLRFHRVKRGHSCTDQHWNPPHPRQLHRSTNKGHAVWVKRVQIHNSKWSWSAWALIHFCRPNTIDASQLPPGSRPAGPDKNCPQIPDQCSLADMYSCSKKKNNNFWS